jgi:tetratricopeptide (TPR) repeat protein
VLDKTKRVVVLGGLILGAASLRCGPQVKPSLDPGSLEATMKAGLDALYTARDAPEAVRLFRRVLEQMPSHYGANYQLAAALDAAGRHEEALAQWAHVIQMAEAIHDTTTADAARRSRREAEMSLIMQEGLDALYRRRDPLTASDRFRKVLALLPSHYGATYQLAAALDEAGKPQEARPLWERVQKLAEAIGDTTTADTARTRLQRQP